MSDLYVTGDFDSVSDMIAAAKDPERNVTFRSRPNHVWRWCVTHQARTLSDTASACGWGGSMGGSGDCVMTTAKVFVDDADDEHA